MWKYEGDFTLYDLMQRKDWPYNLEPLLFGQALEGPRNAERRLASLRLVMQQAWPPAPPSAPSAAIHRCRIGRGTGSVAGASRVCARTDALSLRKAERNQRAKDRAASRPASSARASSKAVAS